MTMAVERMRLTDCFRIAGWIPREDRPAMYALADTVAMPSAREGMALAYLETLASGRVLVASDNPASRLLVRHGENGLLHPVGDVPTLAERIVAAALDPGLRARIGAKARASALQHDIEHVVDAHAAALRKLVERRSAR
jgi:glycosyltransferase involved in cell wall biosynthesis